MIDDPLNEEITNAPIAGSMNAWFDMIMNDTKVTPENFLEKQMEQSNIRLKYLRYKYKYSVQLNREKIDLDKYVLVEMEKLGKQNMLRDDKQKLSIIKTYEEYTRRLHDISKLQAIYDTISDAMASVNDIGYAANNIIKQLEFDRQLEKGI
jgi:DNA repair ATPase RecN